MIQLTLLEQAIDSEDSVLSAFVQHVAPRLIRDYTLLTAKGGRFAEELHAKGIDTEHFGRDQSMLTHLLNGIFPTMRLLNLLNKRGLDLFSDIEKQIYLTAYCMHDIDKVLKQQATGGEHVTLAKGGLDTHNRLALDAIAHEVEQQIKALSIDTFFPSYKNYLDDIVFLLINTQKARGTHLNTYLFRFGLKERRLTHLRHLCIYSDVITYLVRSPSDIVNGGGASSLREELASISQNTLQFAYHKMKDVRGLLTNVLNNSVIYLLQEKGLIPYLFFPDGVVYLTEIGNALQLDETVVTQAAKQELVKVCKGKIKHSTPGFKFDPKGLVKKPQYYHDFLSVGDYVRLIATKAITMTVNDISASPAAKLLELQAKGLIPAEIDVAFVPDTRIGIIARFLINLWKEVFDNLKDESLRQKLADYVLTRLDLINLWSLAEGIPNIGGVEYKWFWLAAQYVVQHKGIDNYQGEDSLHNLFTEIIETILSEVEPHLEKVFQGSYLSHIGPYLEETLELYPRIITSNLPNFAGELSQYAGAKRLRKATLICTTCHSAYPTAQQEDAAVLFQPWVYKNKLPLYAGSNAGGICALCSLELMLRQIMLKGELRLTGSKFEALRTKYIYLYPAYFFTIETANVIHEFIDRFKNINFFEVRKQLKKSDLTISDFLQLTDFMLINEEDEEAKDSEYLKMEYPLDSFPALVFFGMKARDKDSDTEAWVKPAFLSLALPLILCQRKQSTLDQCCEPCIAGQAVDMCN